MNKEIWKSIKDYESIYEVSNHGRVRSLDRMELMKNGVTRRRRGKVLSAKRNNKDYIKVDLAKSGINKTNAIHRLVAIHFIKGYDESKQVNHIDGNKQNNHHSNLEWVTASENNKHAYKIGLKTQYGTTNPQNKLSKEEVLAIRKLEGSNLSQTAIGNKFGVSRGTVRDIHSRRIWGWLEDVVIADGL